MDYNLLLGVLFTALFIGAALMHLRENTQLEKAIGSKADEATSKWIVRFAWSRTLQLLGALGCIIVLIIHYDKQVSALSANLESLITAVEQKNQAEQQAKKAAAAAAATQPVSRPKSVQDLPRRPTPHIPSPAAAPAPTIAAPQPQPQTPPPAPAPTAPAQPQSAVTPNAAPGVLTASSAAAAQAVPPVAYAAPAPSPAPAQPNFGDQALTEGTVNPVQPEGQLTASSANALQSRSETIEALYNPERTRADTQSAMDDIKKRYEDILVIYIFLKKCGKVRPTDYRIISNALTQEMANVGAPARLQTDILDAAKGSYNEIYSRSPCDGQGSAELNDQYVSYVKVLADNFPLPQQ